MSKPFEAAWHQELNPSDLAELRRWIELSGAGCVARVAAALTAGGRGNVTKPDYDLLMQMARKMRRQPLMTTHAAALEAAQSGRQDGRPGVDLASLVKKLEREFSRHRTQLYLLAEKEAATVSAEESGPVPYSPDGWRAFGRAMQFLPTAIDLYDFALAEAGRVQPDRLDALKRMGRERVRLLLAAALERQALGQRGSREIPRTFVDLIEDDLARLEGGA